MAGGFLDLGECGCPRCHFRQQTSTRCERDFVVGMVVPVLLVANLCRFARHCEFVGATDPAPAVRISSSGGVLAGGELAVLYPRSHHFYARRVQVWAGRSLQALVVQAVVVMGVYMVVVHSG